MAIEEPSISKRFSLLLALAAALALFGAQPALAADAQALASEPEAIEESAVSGTGNAALVLEETLDQPVSDELEDAAGATEAPEASEPVLPEAEAPAEPEPEPEPEAEVEAESPSAFAVGDGWEETPEGVLYWQDGEKTHGLATIDGALYLFDDQGYQLFGLQEHEGHSYYFDPQSTPRAGAALIGEWKKLQGKKHHFGEDGRMSTGECLIEGARYLFDPESGTMLTGWQRVGEANKLYYLSTGALVKGPVIKRVGDELFCINARGEALSGVRSVDKGKSYYLFAASDVPGENFALTGWQKLDGKRYYADPTTKKLACGLTVIAGKTYLFSAKGVMLTGWQRLDSASMYFHSSTGALVKGPAVKTLDGKVYCINAKGVALSGIRSIDKGKTHYLFAESDVPGENFALTGWQKHQGKTYYCDPKTCKVVKGKLTLDGMTYSFDAKTGQLKGAVPASLKKGWNKVGSDWYWSDDAKTTKTGWLNTGGKWYYLLPKEYGRMATGLISDKGADYWLNSPNGDMAASTNVKLPDGSERYAASSGALGPARKAGVYYNENGGYASGWLNYAGKWYFIDGATGRPKTGWIKDGGKDYWLDSKGVMATGRKTVDGKLYTFASSGEMVKSGWQNPAGMYQVSSKNVSLPYSGIFGYASPSKIKADATRAQVINAFVKRAYEYIGTTYVWDYACAPGVGVDCAGLVLQCMYAVGINPGYYNPYDHYYTAGHNHYAVDMRNDSRFKSVAYADRQVGDLVFYSGHVAIYIGNNQIIHALGPGGVNTVLISPVDIFDPIAVKRPFV